MNEHVFALDIGTQSVTGIILQKTNDSYKVIDFCVRQHKERSMLDGQIQNVVQVAEVITEVKCALEKKHGLLQHVCVAAAGRALKTIQTEKSISIKDKPITSEEEIKHLELSAVQQAQALLAKENKHNFTNYHCVGFSILHYKLDGEKIGSFIDQVGKEATVEIIATFLPKIVVESLLAALERADLTMEALTLEPIAAIHVLIPESMRRLNIALIDIGAGTSDIAISNDGTVVAYGMVPIAGDEITEAISDHYLLDFKVAEETKRKIINDQEATVHDILGFESTITYEDLVPQIAESVDRLANLLATEIRHLNAKAPQAVMLIGGGSLTPKLNEKLATYLQLPANRVAMRGIEAIQCLKSNEGLPTGPEFVTPVGIAISATQNPLHYITVYVNDKVTLMFETKQLTVGDAIIQAGIEVNKYYGKIGLASIITFNGKKMTLRGEYGEPPTIFVNDQAATVDSLIASGDKIVIHKGKDGKNSTVTLEEIVGDMKEIPFTYNDQEFVLKPVYQANGQIVDKNYLVQDKDTIHVVMAKTIADFLSEQTLLNDQEKEDFFVIVNERKVKLDKGSTIILVNGKQANMTTYIHEEDQITMTPSENVTVKTLLHQLDKQFDYQIHVTFNGEPVELKQNRMTMIRDDQPLKETSELHHGDRLVLKETNVRAFIFQDIFRYVDIDLSQTRGSYKLYKNNELTTFLEEVIHGDKLEIVWE